MLTQIHSKARLAGNFRYSVVSMHRGVKVSSIDHTVFSGHTKPFNWPFNLHQILVYHVTHTKLNIYADDQQIYDSHVNPVHLEERITHYVQVANQWYRYNGMIVNESKYQAMVLGSADHVFSLPVQSAIDIFGLNIENNLCFDNHISTICKKINKQFNVMLRLQNLIPSDTKVKLYKALTLPHFLLLLYSVAFLWST